MTPPRCTASQRGAGALVIILVLAFTAWMFMAGAHRSLVSEQRGSANQYRATQAFEAAEAGLEWTLGQLNQGDAIDDHCEPDTRDASVAPPLDFRDRYLNNASPPPVPTKGVAAASPSCQHDGGTWTCHCPFASTTAAEPGNPPSTLSFSVALNRPSSPGLVEVVSRGCVGAGACDGQADARAQVRATFGLIAAPSFDPAAALTVRGSVNLGDAPWVIGTGLPPDIGMAIHAGGDINATRLTVQGSAGAPVGASSLDGDDALQNLSSQALFTTLFRMDKTLWQRQPTVRRVDCASPCDEALRTALGPGASHPMVWLDHGLTLREPTTLGTPTHPVLLVVDGPVRFEAPVVVHGLVYGTSASWHDNDGATVHGAVVLEDKLDGRGATRINYDPAVLRRLRARAGTFARVAGSWRDF